MAHLNFISPFFIVSNLKVSVSFYVESLGFEIRYMGPNDAPFFAMIGRDDISIMLKEINPAVIASPNYTRHEWAAWDAFVSVSDPDALFEEYHLAGVKFRQPIRNDDDGLRGFEIADADGYVLFFGRPI
jgi:catechol 2,3-dioxygenase-like lactoylglutathione lyase family enzyme